MSAGSVLDGCGNDLGSVSVCAGGVAVVAAGAAILIASLPFDAAALVAIAGGLLVIATVADLVSVVTSIASTVSTCINGPISKCLASATSTLLSIVLFKAGAQLAMKVAREIGPELSRVSRLGLRKALELGGGALSVGASVVTSTGDALAKGYSYFAQCLGYGLGLAVSGFWDVYGSGSAN